MMIDWNSATPFASLSNGMRLDLALAFFIPVNG